jgi:type IV pilus assembly protein PilO
MKISSREKALVGILGTVLVVVLYYQFVYIKQVDKLNKLNTERQQLKAQYDVLMDTVNQLDSKKSDLKILNSKIYDKSNGLYPSIIQEKLIVEIDDLMKKSNVKGNLSFSNEDTKAVSDGTKAKDKKAENSLQTYVDQYNGEKSSTKANDSGTTANSNSQANSQNQQANTLNVNQMKLTLNYRGSYDNLRSLISNIEQNPKKIVLSNVTMSYSGNQQVSGVLNLNYYSVPKIGKEDEEYFKWTINNDYGKKNPFDSSAVAENNNSSKNAKYDFLLSSRPIKSDLATVSLRYGSDKKLETSVYADNASNENVEITLTQKDGKYYYKYKTSKESYPKDYSALGVKFTPLSDDIVLDILSNIRLDSKDASGVNLKVINNTDKNVYVDIRGDDTIRPRVNVSSQGKTVSVNNIK